MSNGVSSICSAANWWFEIRLVRGKKVLRRLPVAAWMLTAEETFQAICFDAGRAFTATTETDDPRLEYRFQYGTELKQIGDGIVYVDELPKLAGHKTKK